MAKQRVKNRIISTYKEKRSYRQISKDLNIPVSTVRYIIKKFNTNGSHENLPRSGAPRKISQSQRSLHKMVRRVKNEPFVTRDKLQEDLSATGIQVCKKTISSELHRHKLESFKLCKTPMLKKCHFKSRLDFAISNFKQDDDYSKQVVWSNETKIELLMI